MALGDAAADLRAVRGCAAGRRSDRRACTPSQESVAPTSWRGELKPCLVLASKRISTDSNFWPELAFSRPRFQTQGSHRRCSFFRRVHVVVSCASCRRGGSWGGAGVRWVTLVIGGERAVEIKFLLGVRPSQNDSNPLRLVCGARAIAREALQPSSRRRGQHPR